MVNFAPQAKIFRSKSEYTVVHFAPQAKNFRSESEYTMVNFAPQAKNFGIFERDLGN